jgi:chloramphenicol-sensitive protein RarD
VADPELRTGIWLSLGAYGAWGLFPLYFKALRVPPLEVLANRVVWSALFLVLVLGVQGRLAALGAALRSRQIVLRSLLNGSLLAVNWFVYIWAVAERRVVDASLGYFITPLVSVVLGVALFAETLRLAQRLAIGIAAAGVVWLTLQFGKLPWVGLILALTFGTYGALRKKGVLGALDGLLLEQVLMLPLAVAYLSWLGTRGHNAFQSAGLAQSLLLSLSGPLSSVPLLLFAAGARRIPLSLVGLLQYISPTIQLMLGVWVWHEPFNSIKAVGYALIWLGLLLYSIEGVWMAKLRRRARVAV